MILRLALLKLISIPENLSWNAHRRMEHSFSIKTFDILLVFVPLLLPQFSACVALTLHIIRTSTRRVEWIWGKPVEGL